MNASEFEGYVLALYDEFGPGVCRVPNIGSATDAEFVRAVGLATGCKPGIWPLPPPYDDSDVPPPDEYGVAWESVDRPKPLPTHKWANDANQSVLETICNQAGYFYSNDWLLVDAALSDTTLHQLLPPARLSAPPQVLFERISENLGCLKWMLIPFGDDALEMLFVCAGEEAEWISRIEEWCRETGRDHTRAWKEGRNLVGAGTLSGHHVDRVEVWVPL